MGVNSVNRIANIQSAIAQASQKTGIDFNYLMGQAQVESGFRADARAGTSSATGLYQFVDQSWLGVIKQHGAENGLSWAADSIKQGSNGRYYVADAGTRSAILEMRKDPNVAALMAAEHASDNKDALENSLGRTATGSDLYMAHFLGLGGARNFLNAMDKNPDRIAANMFPAAARANRSVFYASNGQPRTLQQVYDRLSDKLDNGAAAVGATGSASGASASQYDWSGSLNEGGEVVLGNQASRGDSDWIKTTLANINTLKEPMNVMRPTPENAKLAYMMLASLGA